MLDKYLKGASTRLAPEAPVPVVDILSCSTALGGGGNTAINLKCLGANVTFCSIAGADDEGDRAIEILRRHNINPHILQDKSQITNVKTRVMAGTQLLVRFDSGTEFSIGEDLEQSFIKLLHEQYYLHDAIVISDYNKGLLTPLVISTLRKLNQQEKKFIAIDSKRLEAFQTLSPSIVKPNYLELVDLLKVKKQYTNRVEQINGLGKEIFFNTKSAITAVTLDQDGAVIFSEDEMKYRCFAHHPSNIQVAGAGDAFFSAFTLAIYIGAEIPAAAEISAAAAAVAISKGTTAYCTHQELNAALSINEKYLADPDQLQYIVELYKAQGKKIVFTNGCFDLLHSGHVNFLNRARELGHILIVGINTDESIQRIKGAQRPINKLQDRIEVLSGLGSVSHIISYGDDKNDEAIRLINMISPDVYTKGGDYTRENLSETSFVEKLGGEVIVLPFSPNRSTTLTIQKINEIDRLKLA